MNAATREMLVTLRGQLSNAGKAIEDRGGGTIFVLLLRHLKGAVKAIDGMLKR